MPWQKRFTLPPHTKGMHLVTDAVLRECQEGLKGVDIGIFTLNCLHTSAGLTVCDEFPADCYQLTLLGE